MLLVEGKDDKIVLERICAGRGTVSDCEIETPKDGGIDQLLQSFKVRLKTFNEEGDIVGIVIDADANLDSRWISIRNRLIEAGYEDLPAQPDPDGTIIHATDEPPLPKVGIWIMPDNKTSGILEDFLKFLIPQEDRLLDHVNACIDSAPIQLFSNNDRPKAVIHTWLAWQKEPGKPYGTAITAKFLDPNVPKVSVLVSWMERLFSDE